MANLFPHINFAGRSDIGCKRTNNEDAFGMFPESGIFCVSDGMGGGDDGEVASAATVKAVEEFCAANPLPAPQTYVLDDLVQGIDNAVNGASKWIFRRAQEKNLKGCGATFVGICFDAANPDEAAVLHAGDSRLYRIRGRNIQQITKDHSAAELIGAKNEKDVNPMFRGMILRAVGIQSFVEVERTPLPVKAGDRILICSDGLSRMVPDKKLLAISKANADAEKAVEAMIAAANEAGGIDNVTAVVVDVGELPTPLVAVPLPGLPRGGDTTTLSGMSGRSTDGDTDTNSSSDMDSGAGFVTCDGGVGAEDCATATNTLATFSGSESMSGMPGVISTACTEDDEPPRTRDDEHMQALRAKARRIRRVRFFIRGLSVLLALGVAGIIFLHRQKLAAERRHAVEIAEARRHAQEVEREAEERLAREKAAAEKMMSIEKKRAAELDAKRKAAAAAAEMETKKAEQEAEAAREAQRKADAEKQKAEKERLARKKAEAEVAELQEANRKAREEVAKLQEANRKAKAKAEAERRAREEAAKKKAEAERHAREEAAKKKAEAERRSTENQEKEREAALKELVAASAQRPVTEYVRKLCQLNCEEMVGDLPAQFMELRATGTSPERKKVLADAIVQKVQKSVKELQDYASYDLEQLGDDLKEANGKRQEILREQMSLRLDFCAEAKEFLATPPNSPKAHGQCARMICEIPRWFK